jgi:hypothetical protein
MILGDSARFKSQVTTHQGCTNFGRQKAVATKFWAVAPELASDASDFEVAPTFLENMYIPDLRVCLQIPSVDDGQSPETKQTYI